MSKLNALKIKSLTKVGMHSDGNGLHLKIQLSKKTNTLNKSWIFRWGAQGKNSMGLGSLTDVSLADARAKTLECKKLVANGLNPRDERDKVKVEQKAAKAHSITFEKAACCRRSNIDHLCRLNFDQGLEPALMSAGCG